MAIFPLSSNIASPIGDNGSDYGSDVDDATADELFSQAESQPMKDVVLESIEEPAIPRNESLEQRIKLRLSRLRAGANADNSEAFVREASVEVEYDEGNRVAFSPSNPESPSRSTSLGPQPIPEKKDTRSPIQRFRQRPKKPLSVTDLVSPAWCEQQYEYNLSKYGRVRRTPAMKQGSNVHKVLEEQVHVEVPIEIETKEDRFGLRIWNAVQGLRTLRETGLTRELEVWGVVEGEVVIGIIDEIGTVCHDEVMEAAIVEDLQKTSKKGPRKKEQPLPPDQRTLTSFLTSSQQGGSVLESNPAFLGSLQESRFGNTYYLSDIKTRQSATLPAPGSQSRPTHMQLMLYHRLLTCLGANSVPGEKIFERYDLDSNKTFSDTFLAQIAGLDPSSYIPVPVDGEEDDRKQVRDHLTELLQHNTLLSLWTLLTSECALTFPLPTSISPLLTAEYRHPSNPKDPSIESGSLIGRRSFPLDAMRLDAYVQDEMRWWKGERETKGVEVEEAYKCRICEFAEVCEWRATKIEEGVRKARLRSGTRRKSEI